MNTCPEVNQLNELIRGMLPKQAAESLTEHLGDCQRCQEEMQKLAAGESSVDSLLVETTAAVPPAQSAYWKVRDTILQRSPASGMDQGGMDKNLMQTRAFGTDDTASSVRQSEGDVDLVVFADDELAYLEPSEDPAYIGRLQHFEILRVIGRGGMGVVLEAFDPQLNRKVAIKVLNAQFQQNAEAIERFLREGRAAASVSHEHVVQMHQVANIEESKIAFLVMQFIEGKTLEAYSKEKSPLEPGEVARIGMQIAAGLSAAHGSGLVHRDIKPGNILIEDDTDRVKITDFGLAWTDSDLKLTQTGMLLGTALYMSPEQALGQNVDERSDLFSLGAVLYEMATGVSPFEAPTAVGVMKRIMDENPPSPRKLNDQIGKPMSDLIAQLLSKKPNDRPDSASLVARALASIVTEHGPISPLQVPSVSSSEVRKLSNRSSLVSRVAAIGGWMVAVSLLAALALPFLFGWESWLGGGAAVESANPDAVVVTLNSTDSAKDVTADFPSVMLGDNPGAVWSIDFTPGGRKIAAGVGDGSVRIWDIEKQEVVRSFNAHDGNVWNIEFHPTLELLATVGDDAWVKLWDAKTFELKHGWKADNTVRAMAFSPDEKVLVAGDRAGKIHVYDIKTGQETETHSQEGTILGVDFSGDGKTIATVGSDKTVRVFDASTFDQRQDFTGHEGPIYSVSFAAKGPLLASAGFKSDVWVWNSDTGKNVFQLQGSGGDNWGLCFCDQDRQLLTGNQEGATLLWSLETGTLIATFKGHSAPVHDIALDPVSDRIATSSRDGTIRIWDAKALKELSE